MVWTLNENYIKSEPRLLMSTILESLPDLKFRSADGLYHLYLGLIDMTIEMAEVERKEVQGAKRGVLTRYINSLKSRKKRPLPSAQPEMLRIMYDVVLVADGMGLLHGFGFGNKWGDQIAGNPEYKSIYNIEPIKREERTMSDEIKRSQLVAVAKELNELLGLDPAIDVKAKPTELKEKLIEAAGLLTEDDILTEATEAILKTLQSDVRTDEEKEGEADPGEDPEVPEVLEVDLLAMVKGTKKLADLKEIVLEYDEFKKLRKGIDAFQGLSGPKDLKAAMLKVLGGGVEARQEKAAPAGKKTTGSGDLMDFLTSQIQAGKFTRGQIQEAAAKRFPDLKMSTISTILSDGKNPKYSKFPVPYVVGEEGFLYFPDKK